MPAHQINNIMKELLKLPLFLDVVTSAVNCVNTLNGSSSKWLVRAKNAMLHHYGKYMELLTIAETRWNSSQMMLASVLRVQSALKTFYNKWNRDPEFPSAFECLDDRNFWTGKNISVM
jgi:hypothetical protein